MQIKESKCPGKGNECRRRESQRNGDGKRGAGSTAVVGAPQAQQKLQDRCRASVVSPPLLGWQQFQLLSEAQGVCCLPSRPARPELVWLPGKKEDCSSAGQFQSEGSVSVLSQKIKGEVWATLLCLSIPCLNLHFLSQQWEQKTVHLPLHPPLPGHGLDHMLGSLFLSTGYEGNPEPLSQTSVSNFKLSK